LTAVEETSRNSRAAMGASANGQALDSYVDASKRLTQLIAAVQAQLKSATRYPRYRGVLKVWSDPDLVSADDIGMVRLVLGAEADAYKAAIDVLVAIKTGGDK
jgi:hypothetical protein